MPTIDTTKPQETDSGPIYVPLETDAYLMKITSAQIAPSTYKDDRGEFPIELTVIFELMEKLTHPEPDVEFRDRQFWHIKYFYGDLRSGGPSKFKAFIDGLIAEGKINNEVFIAGETDDPKVGDLIGIQRRVMIEKYTVGQGKNAGQLGNKVLAVTSPKSNGQPQQAKPVQTFSKPAAPNLDDIEEAERKSRLEYLGKVYDGIDDASWTTEQLVEAAIEFAGFLQHPDWSAKKYSARNAVQLRGDVKAMWGMIQRNELVRDPDATVF